MEKISILTDAGEGIGFGHVSRCRSLLQAFEERGVRPTMRLMDPPTRPQRARALNAAGRADAVIIDSYYLTAPEYRRLAAAVPLIVSFDDVRRMAYPAGWVVNGAVLAHTLSYHGGLSRALIGPRYQPVRRAFWNVRPRPVSRTIGRIFLYVDALRPALRRRTVERLLTVTPARLEILSQSFVFKPADRAAARRVRVHRTTDDRTVLSLMRACDLAVTGGGQITYELARLGIPSILIRAVDNQDLIIKGWEKRGFAQSIDPRRPGFLNDLESVLARYDYASRKKMAAIGRKTIDGQGSRRIVQEVLKWIQSN